MNRKLFLICSATGALLLIIGVAFSLSGQTLSSTVSANRKYKVEISQEKDAAGIERYVYLNAYRNGEQFVRSKLIYTGDTLDNDFRDLYPIYSWVSESVLKIGRKVEETQSNSLHITNESSRRLSYLLIETYRDKYVLFDVAPKSTVDLKFQFLGQLSCQGEFAESKRRFGTAVRLASDAENQVHGNFSVGIKETNATIKSRLKLKTVTCCAVDRPDIHHEQFYR